MVASVFVHELKDAQIEQVAKLRDNAFSTGNLLNFFSSPDEQGSRNRTLWEVVKKSTSENNYPGHIVPTQHRRDSGSLFIHYLHTDSPALFYIHEGWDNVRFHRYCQTTWNNNLIDENVTEEFLPRLLKTSWENRTIYPQLGPHFLYTNDIVSNGPLGILTKDVGLKAEDFLFANIIEYALISPMYDKEPQDLLGANRNWLDWLTVSEDDLNEIRGCFGANESFERLVFKASNMWRGLSLDQLVRESTGGIPGGLDYAPPALGSTDVFKYIRERLGWIILTGDRYLMFIALKALLNARNLGNEAKNDYLKKTVCPLFFTLHQSVTAPIFSSKGGIVNVSDADMHYWHEALNAFSQTGVDRGMFRHMIAVASLLITRLSKGLSERPVEDHYGYIRDSLPFALDTSPFLPRDQLEKINSMGEPKGVGNLNAMNDQSLDQFIQSLRRFYPIPNVDWWGNASLVAPTIISIISAFAAGYSGEDYNRLLPLIAAAGVGITLVREGIRVPPNNNACINLPTIFSNGMVFKPEFLKWQDGTRNELIVPVEKRARDRFYFFNRLKIPPAVDNLFVG